MLFAGKLSDYLKPLNPLTFEQLLVELAAAPDGVLLYVGHGDTNGVILPLTEGARPHATDVALDELVVLADQEAARRTLGAPPSSSEARKAFLKKVVDLVVQFYTAMNAVYQQHHQQTSTILDVTRLKQNIDQGAKNPWEGYDFSGFKPEEIPPADLVQWCNREFTAYAETFGFPNLTRLDRFLDRRKAVQAKDARLELRICRAGRSQDTLKALRKFLGDRSKVTAPVGYFGFGSLYMRQIQGGGGQSPRQVFDAALRKAQTSLGPGDSYRLFMSKAGVAPAPGAPGASAAPPPAADAGAAPSPQPRGAPSASQATLPPAPTTATATILLTMHETERGDIHTAVYQSWYINEADYDAFLLDYCMDGRPGFRVPAGKNKYQAAVQYIVTDDLTNLIAGDPALAQQTDKFNITYKTITGGLPGWPMVLPGDVQYRELLNSEPPWYPPPSGPATP
jgi:hypothetical protein